MTAPTTFGRRVFAKDERNLPRVKVSLFTERQQRRARQAQTERKGRA